MSTRKNLSPRRPSTTHLVLEALVATPGEFATVDSLMLDLGYPADKLHRNRVHAALHNLRAYNAVDVVIQGTPPRGYWFATPGSDERTRTVDEVPSEIHKPRARRRIIAKVQK